MNTQENTINVIIVDDHQLLIDGIKSLLKNEKNIQIAGEALSGEQALELLVNCETDILLADINMPGISGLELVAQISKKYPSIKCIVLTMHDDREIISEALKSGAKGYVLKNTGRRELIEAIQKVYDGGHFFGEEVTNVMLNDFLIKKAPVEEPEDAMLTNREMEILLLIAKENTNLQIADKLFISERTVETHRKNIFHKTKSKTVAGLIKYAYEHKLI